jgi:hypothetical protein
MHLITCISNQTTTYLLSSEVRGILIKIQIDIEFLDSPEFGERRKGNEQKGNLD